MPYRTNEQLISNEIKRLVPVLGKETSRRLHKAYLLGDEEVKDRIVELVDVLKAAVESNPDFRDTVLMEPPPRSVALDGEIEMGEVLYGKRKMYPVMLTQKDLLTHMSVFGSSGYGKTNISYWVIEKMAELEIPVLVFDFSKRNYRDLLNTPLRDKIDIYTVGRKVSPFKFNPLFPPEGIQLSQWIKEFSSIFDHAYMLLGGGRYIILKALDEIFEKVKNPKLRDVKAWVRDYGSEAVSVRERNWLATASRPLESLCFREVGEVFECDEGVKPSEFFQKGKITILELDSLDTNDKTFFIEILLQWIRDWLLISQQREQLRGIVILEEAHHVLNRDKGNRTGSETVMDLVFREVRELGLGIVYIDQHPSLVSYPALGNTSTHIYMNLGLDTKHASDILDASNMLGLDYEEQGNYLRKLPVGHGFMLRRMSEFHEPFLVEFPFVPVKKGSVSDEDIKRHMVGKIPVVCEERRKVAREARTILPEDVDAAGLKIIEVLGTARGVFTSQIYKEIKMSGAAFNDKVKGLLSMGAVGVRAAKIKKNRLNYYFLTEEGETLFEGNFGQVKRKTEINSEEIMDILTTGGWNAKLEGDRIVLEGEGKKLDIVLVSDFDRKGLLGHFHDGARYFLCASEFFQNLVLQQAARFCYETGKTITIFINMGKTFTDKGNFEKIEFV